MSCVNWAVPGETGEEAFILGTVGISRIGLENGSKSLDLYFLTDYQISHLTHYSSRFFYLLFLKDLRDLCSPLVLGAPSSPQCCCCAVWWVQTSLFWQFFVKIAATLQALGTLRLVLLYQVFQHCTCIRKCVKEQRETFQCLVCIHLFIHGIR